MKILNNALEFEKYNSKNDETNIFLSNPLKNLHGKDISSQMEKFQSGERLLGMFDAY